MDYQYISLLQKLSEKSYCFGLFQKKIMFDVVNSSSTVGFRRGALSVRIDDHYVKMLFRSRHIEKVGLRYAFDSAL